MCIVSQYGIEQNVSFIRFTIICLKFIFKVIQNPEHLSSENTKPMNRLQQQQLKTAFRRYYDTQRSEEIDMNELNDAIKIYHNQKMSHLSEEEQQKGQSSCLLEQLVRNRSEAPPQRRHEQDSENLHPNNLLSIQEFILKNLTVLSNPEEYQDSTTQQIIFEMLDQDSDGEIGIEDLQNFYSSVGATVTETQIIELLELMTIEGKALSKKFISEIWKKVK